MEKNVFTIGHSNHDLEYFLKVLGNHGIDLLVDVRSTPYSKYSPQFNKKNFKESLQESGIDYFYLGDKIGGRPSNEEYYHEGKVIYSLVAKDKTYLEGINRLMDVIKDKKTVIMCSEEDPHKCHRHNLITQTLLKKGFNVFHIRGDGKIEEVKEKTVQATLM